MASLLVMNSVFLDFIEHGPSMPEGDENCLTERVARLSTCVFFCLALVLSTETSSLCQFSKCAATTVITPNLTWRLHLCSRQTAVSLVASLL